MNNIAEALVECQGCIKKYYISPGDDNWRAHLYQCPHCQKPTSTADLLWSIRTLLAQGTLEEAAALLAGGSDGEGHLWYANGAAAAVMGIKARRPEELLPMVNADSQDELPKMACIARASGEGITSWKVCRNEAEVRAAYVEMVCGSDDEHHKEEIDGIMEAVRGEGWRGDTLRIDLYCASFTVTRFPEACLSPQLIPTETK